MERKQNQAILIDSAVFSVAYNPEDAWYRSRLSSTLSLHLGPALAGERPMHVLLSGPPGCGKTLLAKKQLLSLKEKGIRGCYVNAFEYSSYYLILVAILEKLAKEDHLLCHDRRNADYKLKILKNHLKDKPFVLVLDEIDTLPQPERDDVLYNLSSIPKLGFVLISSDPCVLFTSDKRVQSRVDPYVIEFKPYEKNEMTEILKQYAELGLKEGSYDEELLGKIAEKANGDMRIALTMLKNAAHFAQRDKDTKIQEKHLEEGTVTNRDLRHTYVLKTLKEDHRMIYHVVKEKEPIVSGALWKEYLLTCAEKNKKPIALRTFGVYVKKLLKLNLIRAEQERTRGNVRVFRVAA